MFARLPEAEAAASVKLTVDGASVRACAGDSVAAALLAAGYEHCRGAPVSGAKRGPYCMMGVCFECLVTIDGVGNRQGCLTLVREGMHVALQHGKRSAGT
jgi:predicted molibdopterin-dependent oxidoreductase YjgC